MNRKQFEVFRGLVPVLWLMAGFAPAVLAAPADDAATILADCKKTLDRKLEDCCEDYTERADRGVKHIEKELEGGKCNSARKKRDTSLNLIGKDHDSCTLKLGDLGAECGKKLDKAIEDPEALAEAEAELRTLLEGVAGKLTACYDPERSRILDAYTTGAAEAGCDE